MNKTLITVIMAMCFLAIPGLAVEYVTVVGEDAPSSDVATAIDFAATFSALDMTFTGKIDSDVLQENPSFEDYYFVVIDDNTISLIGSVQYHEQVVEYFQEKDFSVETIQNPTLEDLLVTAELEAEAEPTPSIDETAPQETSTQEENTAQNNATQEDVVEQPCIGCELDEECYSQGTVQDGEYCDGSAFQAQQEDGASCSQEYECMSNQCSDNTCGEEQPGVVTRVLSWFASLF